MRWWLVRNAVLQQLYTLSTAVLLLTAFWTQVARGRMTAVAVMGSMIATSQLGFFMTATLTSREVRLLPVSRAAIWQATWILSVVAAPLMVALGKLVGGFAIWMGNGDVAAFVALASLSSLYDVLFAGVMVLAKIAMTWMPTPRSRRLRRVAIEVWPFVCLLVLFPGSWLLPVLAYQVLPRAWTAMTWYSALCLVAAAGVGVATWFNPTPPPAALLIDRSGSVAPRSSNRPPAATASGWPVLAWLELRFLLVIVTLVVIAAIVAEPALRLYGRTASLPDMASRVLRYFFNSSSSSASPSHVLAAALIGMMATSNLLQPMLRQLRSLPVSHANLTVILLLLPVLHVAVIWGLVAFLYVLSEHAWPPALRLEIVAMAAGFAIYAQSFQMRFPRRGLQFSTALLPALMLMAWKVLGGGDDYEPVALFIAGATTLCIALGAILTRQSLNRAATYRQDALLSAWSVPPPRTR